MATLSRELRKALERVVLAARREAEAGARKALDQLAVAHHEPWTTMPGDQQKLRRRLRARGRQLGDRLEDAGKQGVEHLVSECAYEQWHRMLFARFLAECGLLIEPASGVSVSVDECKELARERGVDWISLASTFAQGTLPQIFRADDAVLEIALPAEHRQPLEQLLTSLPSEVFLADDSLGWVYQFWQSDAKDLVNRSGAKIGADQLPAVTQLFTEDYMVEFLLHNTIGAWWSGKLGPIQAHTEEEARGRAELPLRDGLRVAWTYLRFVQDEQTKTWSPAAGTFSAWPARVMSIRFLDPCVGSGHFVAFALPLLARMRMEEEGLSAAQAIHATLRDNVFALELDERCAQIAAFNVALTAWKSGGYQLLPPLHVACSGLAPHAAEKDWVLLAGDDERLRLGMARLHALFRDAPLLGSLINPRASGGDLVEADFNELQPLLEEALARETKDDTAHEMVATAHGLAKAAKILAGQFTLVATNVPYLGHDKQEAHLREYCERVHTDAKADLATCFVDRCIDLCTIGGSTALVTPQSWLYQDSFKKFRPILLDSSSFNLLGRLGPGAFETISGEVVNVCMVTITKSKPADGHALFGVDVSNLRSTSEKRLGLQEDDLVSAEQAALRKNPQSKISLEALGVRQLLADYATSHLGICTGDYSHFGRFFWEVSSLGKAWSPEHSTVDRSCLYGGMSNVLLWERGKGQFVQFLKERLGENGMYQWLRGEEAWGKKGVIVSATGSLPASLYLGDLFDNNVTVIVPKDETHLPAVWAFCESREFHDAVRRINQSLKITDQSMVEVPFDLARWQKVAEEKYSHDLPKPFSEDPTQWLFDGHPKGSDHPLHVAVARLLGYCWPRQTGSSFSNCPSLEPDGLESCAAGDGIVCISSVKGEDAAVPRLSALLSCAYGREWNAAKLSQLLNEVGYDGQTLEEWLRDGFFEQHCDLFHQRPFLWHVWDGRRDGFSALVNYHNLTRANLEKLTYAYLGDWIRRQEASVGAGDPGSDARLVAAKQLQEQLKKILEGEAPHDIFVRWKAITQQPIGWEPDLDDGVRLNLRPFLMAIDVGRKGAGILRFRPKIKWDKDRGKEPARPKDELPWFWGWDGKANNFAGGSSFDGNRWNDLHYSREFKVAARKGTGLS